MWREGVAAVGPQHAAAAAVGPQHAAAAPSTRLSLRVEVIIRHRSQHDETQSLFFLSFCHFF